MVGLVGFSPGLGIFGLSLSFCWVVGLVGSGAGLVIVGLSFCFFRMFPLSLGVGGWFVG